MEKIKARLLDTLSTIIRIFPNNQKIRFESLPVRLNSSYFSRLS